MENIEIKNLITVLYPNQIKSCGLVDIAFELYNNFVPYDLAEKEFLFYSNSLGFFNFLQAATIQEERHKELGEIIQSATQIQDLYDVKSFEAKLYMAVSSSPFSNVFMQGDLYKRLLELGKGEYPNSPVDQHSRNVLRKLRNQMIELDNAEHEVKKLNFNMDFYDVSPKQSWLDLKRQKNNEKLWVSQSWRVIGAALENRSDFGFGPTTAKEYHRQASLIVDKALNNKEWKNFPYTEQVKYREYLEKMKLTITSNFEAYFLANNLSGVAVEANKTLSDSIKEVKDKLVSTFTGKKVHKI